MEQMTFASMNQCYNDSECTHYFDVNDSNTANEDTPPEQKVKIEICPDLEISNCKANGYNVELVPKEIKVNDPRTHDQYTACKLWQHLYCWDEKHPSIIKFFVSCDLDIILSAF